jgi:predicted MFS family arabinose efflux permease
MVFLAGIIPIIVVVIGRYFIKEPVRFENLKRMRSLVKSGYDAKKLSEVLEYRVDLNEVNKNTLRQIFATPGYVRNQLIKVMIAWFFYASSWMLTNVFIAYFLSNFYGWDPSYVALLLLISGGIGYFFYPLGGFIGEKIGRRNVLAITAALTPIFAAAFLFSINSLLVASILYFFLYQWTNGTWSGAGYAYWAESFPTRVRGTVMGFLTGWFNFSTFVGGLMFSILVSLVSPSTLWIIMAIGLSIGELSILAARNIKPGQVLEDISF